MTTSILYTSNVNKCSHFGGFSNAIQNYKEIFGDSSVFTGVKPREKGGFDGWNKPENLHNVKESQFLLSRNRIIGLALGIQTTRGYTVCFDKESYGSVPNSVIGRIREKSLFEFESQSGGNNFVLTVTKDALEYLNQFKTKVTFQGDKHDLELLTSGHCIIPPSKIDDESVYNDLQTYPEAPTVDLDSVVQILDNIPVSRKEKESSSNDHSTAEGENPDIQLSKLPSDFDENQYFKENIPGVDSYFERLTKMLENERVTELWYGNHADRSKAELELRSFVAWYFIEDTTMIKHIFETELPQSTGKDVKFNENENHRKDVLENVGDYINRPYYTTGISFNLREQLASQILENETVTVNELLENTLLRTDKVKQYHKRSVQRGLRIFNELGLIERISDTTYRNKLIDEQYVEKLNDLNKEYKPTNIERNYE